MAPELKSTYPWSLPRANRFRSVLVGLAAVLVAVSLGQGVASVRAQVEDEHTLTLTSFECSAEVPLDGSPLAAAECSSEADRAFILSGPQDRSVDLRTALDSATDGAEYRQAVWTADAGDETALSGSWSLREFAPDHDRADVVACLKIVGAKFLPVSLHYREDRSVRFDWNPAERLGPNTVAGEYLECSWYSVPQLSTDERPGLLMIKNAVGSDPSAAGLVIVDQDDDPQGFKNTEAGDITQVAFTVTNDASGKVFEVQSDESTGALGTTFALSPGEYTIVSPSSGRSTSFSLKEGETVLVVNSLEERPTVDDDPTPIAIDPTPIVIDLQPAPTVEVTATVPRLPTVADSPSSDEAQEFEFLASDWTGAYPDVVTAVYGRDCVAIYGRNSQYPSATLTFGADAVGGGQSELVLTGLDDEWSGQNPIVVTVNGEVVFQGSSGFNSWNGSSSQVAWSQIEITFDSELIVDGDNEITVTNQAQAANFGRPPYVLLAEALVVIGSD